ncbi:MAG TPA: lipocalin-like domain-containing protein [Methylocystis sp.]|nr:lipocalin-like domain-containing protein [Methylocystis sp.]
MNDRLRLPACPWRARVSKFTQRVMAGLVPAIHAAPQPTPLGRFRSNRNIAQRLGVDGRDKPGHDVLSLSLKRWRVPIAAALLLAPALADADEFSTLSRKAPGFTEVAPGTPIVFPRDFAAHPGFRIEWWYLTANLRDEAGAAYGAQWTLFRIGLDAEKEREGFANQSLWMAHVAATSAGEHLFTETLARGGVGQAGVEARPFRAFIDDWSMAAPTDAPPDAGLSRLRVKARDAAFAYDLELVTDKPIVLHGDGGYSRKSDRGQASYYFSQPFYTVAGALTLHDRTFKVTGEAWLDREWSSQPLGQGQKGWDWLALHLATGENVMLYRFRSESEPDYFAGTWIAADGAAQPLARDDTIMTPLAQTPIGDKSLPTRWRVEVKSRALAIETRPLNAQAYNGTRSGYWEGPIDFKGSHEGRGYLEMTGY